MYVQSFQFPKLNLRHIPTTLQHKLAFHPKALSGLSSSGKRLSVSRMSSRKSGHLAVIRCGGPHITQENKQEEKHGDEYYMRRCVELAKKAIGCTSPNPMVGCVIVKDEKIVGEGFHPKAGQPHAEVFALRDAGDLAENGTAYVSLEPCNHYGRTPPCTEALIKAKVKRVVVGMVDPNPIVASTGVKKLQDAGIEVKIGVHEEMCKRLNEAYIHQMLTGRPFVTLRYSISLDGHLQNQFGEEVMERGGYYSKLLQEYDAIILSSTALSEKSSLPMSKETGAKQPLKIVLLKGPNSIIQIPSLKTDASSKVIIISENNMIVESEIGREGIEVVYFDKINLDDILEHCKRQGLCSVLLDLMGNVDDFEDIIKEGFEQNLFQKVMVEVLPLFGGDQNYMDIKGEVKKLTSMVTGTSVLLEGYFC